MARLQGLDRGLQALRVVSAHPGGVTIAELAGELGVDRAVAYRIVETLETHALVTRGAGRRVRLSAGIVTLAGGFQPQLVRAAGPVLQQLADDTGQAAFLTVEHGADECIPVLGAEPATQHGPVRAGYRIGMRHRLDRGANGIAILALRLARPDDPPEVVRARKDGFSRTSGQLQQGATGIAAGFEAPGQARASVGVVSMNELDDEVSARVVAAAGRLAALSRE